MGGEGDVRDTLGATLIGVLLSAWCALDSVMTL